MDIGFSHLWGAALVVVGAVWIREREIGVGWEGRPPAYHIRGPAVWAMGAVAIIAGIYLFLHPEMFPHQGRMHL